METFLLSAGLVALGEVGGTTHVLAALMGAQHRNKLQLLLGIFLATLLNHAVAASVGWSLARFLTQHALAGPVGVAFIAIAVWTLLPSERLTRFAPPAPGLGVFGSAFIAFLLAEIGDKSQIAAVALAARTGELAPVIAGTTLGMLLADIPAVLLGRRIARVLPARVLRVLAALLFASIGVLALVAPVAVPSGLRIAR